MKPYRNNGIYYQPQLVYLDFFQNVEMLFFLLLFFAPAALRDDLLEVVLGSDELHSSLTRERALADFSAKVHFGQLGMS